MKMLLRWYLAGSARNTDRFESAVAPGTATRTMTNAYAYLFDLLRDSKISLAYELVEMRVMKQDISCFPLHVHEKEICEHLSDRGESVPRWMVSVYQLRRMTIKPENRCSVETQGLVQLEDTDQDHGLEPRPYD